MTKTAAVASKAVAAIRRSAILLSVASCIANSRLLVIVNIRPVTSTTCEMQMRLQAMPKDAWRSAVAKSSCPYLHLHLHHVRLSKNCVHILRSVERCSGELVQRRRFRREVACDTASTGGRRSVYRCSHRFEVGAHRLCEVRLWNLGGRSLLQLPITLGLIRSGITLTYNEGS